MAEPFVRENAILRPDRQLAAALAATTLLALLLAGLISAAFGVPVAGAATDTRWLRPGVRAWYVGGTDGDSGGPASDAEAAALIYRFAGKKAIVLQNLALDSWTMPLPAGKLIVPDWRREGTFWIAPARLRSLRAPQTIVWKGITCSCKARATYTVNTVPFLRLLPIDALFAVKARRQIVDLLSDDNGVVGEYFFDVDTGLLLSSTERMQGASTSLTLSEINYDFARHRAYAEKAGPHSAFRGWFSAGNAQATQSYQIVSRVLSRYGNVIEADVNGILGNVYGNPSVYPFLDYLLWDGAKRQAFLKTSLTGAWTANGDHLFWWIPTGDLSRSAITVWNIGLARQGDAAGTTTFATNDLAATGFPSVTYDNGGYLSDMTANAPAMGLYVDSRLSPTKQFRIDGRSYYANSMRRAIP